MTRKKTFLKGKIHNIFQFILDIINIKIIAINWQGKKKESTMEILEATENTRIVEKQDQIN